MSKYKFVPYSIPEKSADEMVKDSKEFYQWIDGRRSVRDFSDKPVPKEVLENIVMAASTAPSGAHKQPWTFCLVSSSEIKTKIRAAAEKEEKENYDGRMSDRWLKELAPLGTNDVKEFLETAPWLIVVFKRAYEIEDGEKRNNYYVNESVGIACGFLITAIYNAGLVTLTHTPSPMNFLAKVLNRPENERAFLLLPVGYPEKGATVPDLDRKSLKKVAEYYT
ncbi:MAG: nitroreductase family protein [Flavobacteriales bacterium]|nr:nitroreductase family protein [Flavobacteriales bacterium]PCJ58507.1 MAG: nitroreductase family protein [Planctomycetota bacterium]